MQVAEMLESDATLLAPHTCGKGRQRMLRGATVLAILMGLPIGAQNPGPSHLPTSDRPNFTYDPSEMPDSGMDAKRIRALNVERRKSMVTDAEKLVHLAQELNTDMGAEDLTQTVDERVRKAAEIQKLAKEIKDKMSFSIGDGPKIQAPPSFFQH